MTASSPRRRLASSQADAENVGPSSTPGAEPGAEVGHGLGHHVDPLLEGPLPHLAHLQAHGGGVGLDAPGAGREASRAWSTPKVPPVSP